MGKSYHLGQKKAHTCRKVHSFEYKFIFCQVIVIGTSQLGLVELMMPGQIRSDQIWSLVQAEGRVVELLVFVCFFFPETSKFSVEIPIPSQL
jgi:hypothetical protein